MVISVKKMMRQPMMMMSLMRNKLKVMKMMKKKRMESQLSGKKGDETLINKFLCYPERIPNYVISII